MLPSSTELVKEKVSVLAMTIAEMLKCDTGFVGFGFVWFWFGFVFFMT